MEDLLLPLPEEFGEYEGLRQAPHCNESITDHQNVSFIPITSHHKKANNHCGIVIIHPYMCVCVLTADGEIKNKEREAFRKEFDR